MKKEDIVCVVCDKKFNGTESFTPGQHGYAHLECHREIQSRDLEAARKKLKERMNKLRDAVHT